MFTPHEREKLFLAAVAAPWAALTPGWDATVLGHSELMARYFRS